ncbi:hypothetical protein BDD12DRAFT_338267 [Trichophaea hybrida]|nr:hypothetical protein BDD12DRAFT_338267 [Trichophaea hybrida]
MNHSPHNYFAIFLPPGNCAFGEAVLVQLRHNHEATVNYDHPSFHGPVHWDSRLVSGLAPPIIVPLWNAVSKEQIGRSIDDGFFELSSRDPPLISFSDLNSKPNIRSDSLLHISESRRQYIYWLSHVLVTDVIPVPLLTSPNPYRAGAIHSSG